MTAPLAPLSPTDWLVIAGAAGLCIGALVGALPPHRPGLSEDEHAELVRRIADLRERGE